MDPAIDAGLLSRLILTFAAGAAELWAAVPLGIALGLPGGLVAVAAVGGAMAAAGLVTVLGAPVRERILSRLHRSGPGAGRIETIWVRYGVPGLGIVAPLLVGAPIGTAIGLALGAPARSLFAWMSVGIVLWGTALTLVLALGLAVIPRPE